MTAVVDLFVSILNIICFCIWMRSTGAYGKLIELWREFHSFITRETICSTLLRYKKSSLTFLIWNLTTIFLKEYITDDKNLNYYQHGELFANV